MEHNLWHYLFFIVWLQIKDPTEFTGPESYVAELVKQRSVDWFPRMQAMSLTADVQDTEPVDVNQFLSELRENQQLLRLLAKQIDDIKDVSAPFLLCLLSVCTAANHN